VMCQSTPVRGDVLAGMVDSELSLPRLSNVSPLKSRRPVAKSDELDMHKLRGCNIVFDDGPLSRSVLPEQHMKLQTRSWDGASRNAAFRATQKEARANFRYNQVNQIVRSFPADQPNPFAPQPAMRTESRERLSRSNYRAAAGQRDFSRNMNRGSQGMRFLSHDMPEERSIDFMRRNDAKAAVTSAEVQRIPGDKLNIFCRMRERNKLKCGASNIDLTTRITEAPLDRSARWMDRHRATPSPVPSLQELPKLRTGRVGVELCDVSSMGGGQMYDRYNGRLHASPAAWGVYSL